jgi:hypothetical protein
VGDSRGSFDLVGHAIYPAPLLPAEIDNFIIEPQDPALKWVGELTARIGPWRAKMRSTYIRWALSINGLEVASDKYADPSWQRVNKEFVVTSLRPADEPRADARREVVPTVIAGWDGPKAAEAHRQTMPMLAAFGLIDLYANLEEFVFEVYKIYLNANRDQLLKGEEFRLLRRLKREAETEPGKRYEWERAWQERLKGWHRKRLYDGLGKVFRGFCNSAGIRRPSFYEHSTIESWCESIEIIALIRNCLTHGVDTVSPELAFACQRPHAMTFDFEEGKTLSIRLYHLQGVELFCHQLLTALNISFVEKVYGPKLSQKPSDVRME